MCVARAPHFDWAQCDTLFAPTKERCHVEALETLVGKPSGTVISYLRSNPTVSNCLHNHHQDN